MTFSVLDILLAVAVAAAITVAIAVPRYRQAALGVAASLAAVFGARRIAACLRPEEDEDEREEEPPPPKHTANEHSQQSADDEADAVAAAAETHDVPADVVSDDLAWLDEWREDDAK